MAHSVVSTALTMDISGLREGVKSATEELKKLNTSGSNLSAGLAKISRSLSPVAFLAWGKIAKETFRLVTSATYGFVDSQIKLVKQQYDAAYSLNLSYNQFQALSLAAQQAGLNFERLYEPMSKVVRKIDDAMKGSQTSVQNFGRLGLIPEKLAKLSTYDQFKAVMDALNAIPNAGERAALAMNLFEESGGKFLQLFASGSDGVRQFEQEAKKLNLTLSDIDLGAILKANQAMIRMKAAIQGLKTQVLAGVAPIVERVARYFQEKISANNFVEQAREAFLAVTRTTIEYFARLGSMISDLFIDIQYVVERLSTILNQTENFSWNPFTMGYRMGESYRQTSNGGGGWGDDIPLTREGQKQLVRQQLNDFIGDLYKTIEKGVTGLGAGGGAPYQFKPESDEKPVVQENTKSIRELTAATQQNTAAMTNRLASADDIRSAGGVATMMSPFLGGYGQEKQVTLLEKIKTATEKMANNKPVPVNL